MNHSILYKKTENPQISIDISSIEDYDFYIIKLSEFKQVGISRVVFNCNLVCREKINHLYRLAENMDMDMFFQVEYDEKNLSTFDYKYIIKNVPLSFSDFDKYDTFFEISYQSSQVKDVVSIIQLNRNKNIILNPIGDLTNLDEYDLLINSIISECANVDILFSPIIFPVALIKKHPCNIYLCNGRNCHSGHNGNPRFFKISSDKTIFMFGFIKYKNLTSEAIFDILEAFACSNEYNRFLNVSKKLYIDLLDRYFFSTISWFEWVKHEYL